jgi:phytoene dehydrogenase-like protein
MSARKDSYDVVVVGGGHNGLTAAAYLARAGLSVLVLERLDHLGGAAVSADAFPGTGVRLSRYSYLVSLLPESVVRDLDLDIELRSRATASYSPTVRRGSHLGLFVEHEEGNPTRESFRSVTGDDREYDAWTGFYADVAKVAAKVAPSLTEPLVTARQMAGGLDPEVWSALVERPIGELIESRFSDDLVRGVVATDALIGTFASTHDPSLVQNRCFLYHLIGNGTGEWRVPVRGMGAVTEALTRAAAEAGAELVTSAGVSGIAADDAGAEVSWHDGDRQHSVRAGVVLANVAPWVLRILMGDVPDEATKPVGAQLKINFLLSRLPRLKSGQDPATAFAGTFHVAEEYGALEAAYQQAAAGQIPDLPPGELYCHSLTDPSILGELANYGAHTLTYFGLHLPATLFESHTEERKLEAVTRAIAAIDAHLMEPLLSCVLKAPDGSLCVEAKIPQDVEADLAMPGGHIFHGDLSWPWASNREALVTPAQQWGVATDTGSVMICGSGARRGGAVSGLGGHNAAHAVLSSR